MSKPRIERIPFHGWLNIDKPLGLTSADVVNKIKWLTKAQKVGHAGTLDPAASGVLPIALGEATKTVPYLVDARKTYEFTVKFGEATDTDDAEGKVIKTSEKLPTEQEILAALPAFTGEITQVPPAYSALKVDGQRAYALARAGEKVELNARKVIIYSLQLATCYLQLATFSVTCSKGTYVRAIARDLAETLGTYGHVSALRRTQVGNFMEKDAISLESLEEIVYGAPPLESVPKLLLPLEDALGDIPVWPLDDDSARRIRHGNAVTANAPFGSISLFFQGKIIAIGQSDGHVIAPVRVFNLGSI